MLLPIVRVEEAIQAAGRLPVSPSMGEQASSWPQVPFTGARKPTTSARKNKKTRKKTGVDLRSFFCTCPPDPSTSLRNLLGLLWELASVYLWVFFRHSTGPSWLKTGKGRRARQVAERSRSLRGEGSRSSPPTRRIFVRRRTIWNIPFASDNSRKSFG